MRIKASYRPGQGDNLLEKPDCFKHFYDDAAEPLKIACAKAIVAGSFTQPEAVSLTEWLEDAVPAICAFHYHFTKGRLSSLPEFNFSEATLARFEELVDNWQPCYGGSKEFQLFSNDLNLCLLDEIRSQIRRVELYFLDSVGAVPVRVSGYREELEKMQAGLNRLSTVYWLLINRELSFLALAPKYWSGTMPELKL